MTLKSIFQKPVDRPIEGVIKADDDASLRLEIEEYVLTNEVAKRLEKFLDAYNKYEGANGVWVSGFFGSGKSHLLKMLALLLENRTIDGSHTADLFLPKCADDEILRAELRRAVAIPSKSILFNIDQKSDVISKSQLDALLSVFVKVFDDMCGYYGKQGHIAQFERDLDSRDLFGKFQMAYEKQSNRPWHQGREQALLESNQIARAYADVIGGDVASAQGILDRYRSQYKVSIEDFAGRINDYIEKQPANFRLNFFVDEVGQYIAENIKLMTNLQTIAESLATKCRGRAWIIVTAQEDMNTVVGELGKQQSNDFSKIQARFANRMNLTSADVAEVIQKRLLLKSDEGVRVLSDIYHDECNNFKTLFDFTDGSISYRNFQDRDHFIRSYPFIPYQFSLFQSAIQNLSLHSAFEGKHSSVGERSMLGVFQQVAIQILDHKIGQLATFDLMFEGIRTAIKGNIQRAILQAEKNLDNPLAIRVLKVLFLVKYVKEFKATSRNLCVLMLDDFRQSLPQLRKNIDEALNLLEQQTYVQRNSEQYEFLTDEEKDVEQEIRNTTVETSEVAIELEKIVFDYVIKTRKIRYAENGQDYPYARKLDDKLQSREYEMAIHVISPFHENSENEGVLRSQNIGRDELLVLMPSDDRLVRAMLTYKRTEKYIRQNFSVTQQEAVKRILTDKGFQNRERFSELQQLVQTMLSKAKLYVAGVGLDISSEDAQILITRGFQELVSRTYPNLGMLRGLIYTENDVAACLARTKEGLIGNDVTPLAESEQEVLSFIQSHNRDGARTTLKTLLEKFERKSYGWPYPAVVCTLANLWARGKVDISLDGNLLDGPDLERALLNRDSQANMVLQPQVEFTASQVRALKEFMGDFFDAPARGSDPKMLGKEIASALREMQGDVQTLATQSPEYPFLTALRPVIEKLKELSAKPHTWYFTELARQSDALLDMKESILDPIRKFMMGSQKEIFQNARNFLIAQEPNFAYITSHEPTAISQALADLACFQGNRMQQVKAWLDTLNETITQQISAEKGKAKSAVSHLQERLAAMAEFPLLTSQQRELTLQPFAEFSGTIDRQKVIAVIRDSLRRFEESDYPRLLSQLGAWAQSTSIHAGQDCGAGSGSPTPVAIHDHSIEYVPSRNVNVVFDRPWLADENDVDRYLKSMREALLGQIRSGKRIQL